jgi:hypothetical protein
MRKAFKEALADLDLIADAAKANLDMSFRSTVAMGSAHQRSYLPDLTANRLITHVHANVSA